MNVTNDPEAMLRGIWTRMGVPQEQQDNAIAEIKAKAAPGAFVGPFRVPASRPALRVIEGGRRD